MKRRYIAAFLFIILFGLLFSGCHSVEQVSTFVDEQKPQSVLLFTFSETNRSVGTLFYLKEESEKELIADNVKAGEYKLMPKSEAVLFIDSDNVLWYKAQGSEKEKFSSDVRDFDFSADESTVSFVSLPENSDYQNATLYIKKFGAEKEKMGSDIAEGSDGNYLTYMSDDGGVMFWKTNANDLYRKANGNEKEKIGTDVLTFFMKQNGEFYTYTTTNSLYIKWPTSTEIQKIPNEGVDNVLLSSNGKFAVFAGERTFRNDVNIYELYIAPCGGEPIRIVSAIRDVKLSSDGKSLYYLNEDNELYLKELPDVTEKTAQNQSAFQEELNKTVKAKLCADVAEFRISEDGKNCAIVDNDKNLYVCYQQQEKVRFASDVESYSIFPEMLVYKTAEGKLVLNGVLSDTDNISSHNTTLSEKATNFQTSTYGKYIVFSSDEENTVMICVDGQAPTPLCENADSFDTIVYNEHVVYERKLKLSDIAGIYQDESNFSIFKIGADYTLQAYLVGPEPVIYKVGFDAWSRYAARLTLSHEYGEQFNMKGSFSINEDGTKSLYLYQENVEGGITYKLTTVEDAEFDSVLAHHQLRNLGEAYKVSGVYVPNTQHFYSAPNDSSIRDNSYAGSYVQDVYDYQISDDGKLWLKIQSTSGGVPHSWWIPAPTSNQNQPIDYNDFMLYRVRKTYGDVQSQIGAFKELDNAKQLADTHKAEGYKVFDSSGNVVYIPQ